MNEAMQRPDDRRRGAWLVRLARDRRGNALAIMAIAMIPLTALAGSGIDAGRLYLVKSRLQQACDAGVLAGRRFMTDANATTLDPTATTQANNFFRSNFGSSWMRTNNVVFTPRKTSENRVAGTATARVPMTLMRMFGQPDATVATTCEARFDIADTDIMFVLDTTGSMACLPSDDDATCSSYAGNATKITYSRPAAGAADVTPGYTGSAGYSVTEKSGSRIAALRTAVIDFYDTMNAAKQPTTRVRYGFVPYTSTVNVGAAVRAVSAGYLVGGRGSGDTAPYQSRYVSGEYEASRSNVTNNSISSSNCGRNFTSVRTPARYATFNEYGAATQTGQEYNSSVRRCQDFTRNLGPVWTYQRLDLDVSGLVASAGVANPTRFDPGTSTRWLGCIEEPDTSESGSASFDADNLPPNLDPDLVPSGANRWMPMWPEVEYQRKAAYYSGWSGYIVETTATITTNGDDDNYAPWMGSVRLQQLGNVSCGKPVQRLKELTKAQVQGYVNAVDFAPLGGTYHDTGMLWATRLLSRDGVFAADNAAQSGRVRPNRVIVFLTDGAMSPSPYLYGMFGMEYWDRRIADGNTGSLKSYHNARFLALCNKAKTMGIDIWTVALGTDSTPELESCATSTDQALDTTSGSGLSDAFKRIAKAVAMLRLSK